MTQLEKNRILAEYLNIDFDKLPFNEKMYFAYNWNNVMMVAIKLKDDCYFMPFSFNEFQLSFDIDIIIENCLETIKQLEKYNKLLP